MKVSNQERFVFGILEVAMTVRDTLEYFIPTANAQGVSEGEANEQKIKKFEARKVILKNLTSEHSPLVAFATQNGLGTEKVKDDKTGEEKEVAQRGQRLLDTVHAFINTVYGDDAMFVRVIDNKLVVDPSYFVPVLEQIIGVRETLNDIIAVIMNGIRGDYPQELDPDFDKLVAVEQRFSRAIEFRVLAMQLNSTFLRFQNDIKKYINELRANTTTDPLNDPSFKVTDDPTVAYDNNEMAKLFGYMNFLSEHSHETDDEFKGAVQEMATKIRSFTGNPAITDIKAFMSDFAGIFIPLIKSSGSEFNALFVPAFQAIHEFELANAGQKAEAVQAAAPTTDAEKLNEALSTSGKVTDENIHHTDDVDGQNK